MTDALRSDLCSGLYYARAGARTVSFFGHVVHTLALFEDDVKFGDQAATNLVLFEKGWREGLGGLTFGVLGPLRFPSGGVYYVRRAPQLASVTPVLVHNNFLIGRDKKIQRFREHFQWHLEQDSAFWDTLCGPPPLPPRGWLSAGLLGEPVQAFSLFEAEREAARGEHAPAQTSAALYQHGCSTGRVIVVVSVGARPWFRPHVWPRVLAYAAKTRADVVLVRDLPMCNAAEHDSHSCGKRCKLVAARELLRHYDRLMVLDDTVLVRRDAPDLFVLVPRDHVGAAVEDDAVRSPEENEALVAMSCLKYDASPLDDARAWFNSGVLLLSAPHAATLLTKIPPAMDFVVLGEQGFLNAMRHSCGHPLHNLGYAFNWLGSFNGSNAERRPMNVTDAYMVHATTGLPGYGSDRVGFLGWLDGAWKGGLV